MHSLVEVAGRAEFGRTPREGDDVAVFAAHAGAEVAEASLDELERGAGDDDQELVAAPAEEQVVGADAVADGVGHGSNGVVARGVTGGIIDHLQIIDVDHDHHPLHAMGHGPESMTGERLGEWIDLELELELIARDLQGLHSVAELPPGLLRRHDDHAEAE